MRRATTDRDRACSQEQLQITAENGAGKRNRTSDLLITNQLLYRLSYSGVGARILVSPAHNGNCAGHPAIPWRR